MADHKAVKKGPRKASVKAKRSRAHAEAADPKGHGRHAASPGARAFSCFQCGAQVPRDSDRCPKCKAFYVRGVKSEDVDELLRVEDMKEAAMEDFVERIGTSVIHFDADTGVMQFMGDRIRDPDISFECARCGTLVEFSTDRCPMCGSRPGLEDSGLMAIFDGMVFNPAPIRDADCPFCGERVSLDSGRCPKCSKDLGKCDERDPMWKVNPVLRLNNVVFLHLDIETGEISILQRNPAGRGYDHAFMRLDEVAGADAERSRCGSSRS